MLTRCVFLFSVIFAVGCAGEVEPAPAVEAAPESPSARRELDPGGARAVDWPDASNASHEGVVYFAGQPGAAGLLHGFEIGVELVVNLRTAGEMTGVGYDEAAEVKRLGMEYVTIPIRAGTFSKADVTAFGNALRETPGPVLVHCRSSNRVGALWAAYLTLEEGVPLGDALERGRKAGMTKPILEAAVERVVAE